MRLLYEIVLPYCTTHILHSPNPDACGVAGCTTRYSGPLCANCASGFSRGRGFECSPCLSTVETIFSIIGFGCLGVLIFGVLIRSNIKSYKEKAQVHSVVLKIFLGAMQLNSMVTLLDLKFPGALNGLIQAQVATSISSGEINFGCIFPENDSYFIRTTLLSLMPVIIIALFSGIFGFVRCCTKRFQLQHLFLACCVGVTMAYISVAINTSSLFSCRQVDDVSFLLGNVNVECWSAHHSKWLFAVGLPSIIVNVIGVPCFFLWQIIKNRNKLQQDDETTMLKLSYITKGYRVQYWEVVVMTRKLCVAFIGSYFKTVQIQLKFFVGIVTIALVLQTTIRPYTSPFLNRLELLSLGVSWFVFSSAGFLYLDEVPSSFQTTISVTVCIILIVYIGGNGLYLIQAFWKKHKSNVIARLTTFKQTVQTWVSKPGNEEGTCEGGARSEQRGLVSSHSSRGQSKAECMVSLGSQVSGIVPTGSDAVPSQSVELPGVLGPKPLSTLGAATTSHEPMNELLGRSRSPVETSSKPLVTADIEGRSEGSREGRVAIEVSRSNSKGDLGNMDSSSKPRLLIDVQNLGDFEQDRPESSGSNASRLPAARPQGDPLSTDF